MCLGFESSRCCACHPPDYGSLPMTVQNEHLAIPIGLVLRNHPSCRSIAAYSFLTIPAKQVIQLCASPVPNSLELDIHHDDSPVSDPMRMPVVPRIRSTDRHRCDDSPSFLFAPDTGL